MFHRLVSFWPLSVPFNGGCNGLFQSSFSFNLGVEPTDLRVHVVTSETTELSCRPRRQVGAPASVAQHSVGHGLSSRNARGKTDAGFCAMIH